MLNKRKRQEEKKETITIWIRNERTKIRINKEMQDAVIKYWWCTEI